VEIANGRSSREGVDDSLSFDDTPWRSALKKGFGIAYA
jgi:hypothetical protein